MASEYRESLTLNISSVEFCVAFYRYDGKLSQFRYTIKDEWGGVYAEGDDLKLEISGAEDGFLTRGMVALGELLSEFLVARKANDTKDVAYNYFPDSAWDLMPLGADIGDGIKKMVSPVTESKVTPDGVLAAILHAGDDEEIKRIEYAIRMKREELEARRRTVNFATIYVGDKVTLVDTVTPKKLRNKVGTVVDVKSDMKFVIKLDTPDSKWHRFHCDPALVKKID